MWPIILKDLKQSRLAFLFALLIAMVLYAMHGGDIDLVFGLNFGLIAPLFMWISTHASLSGEKSAQTYPFLMSLPLSRRKIWLSKALSSLLIGLICYAMLYILSIALGMKAWPEGYRLLELDFSPSLLFIWFPLIAWATGIFSTVLHPVASSLLVMTVFAFIGFQGFRLGVLNKINWSPYVIWAFILFAPASYQHFVRFAGHENKKLLRYSLASVVVVIILHVFGISLLNSYHEWANRQLNQVNYVSVIPSPHYDRFMIAGIEYLYQNTSDKIFETVSESNRYDLRVFDLTDKKAVAVSHRFLSEIYFDQAAKNIIYTTDQGWFALGKPELILHNLESGKKLKVDAYASPIGFTDAGQVLYSRVAYADAPDKKISRSFLFESAVQTYQSIRSFNPSTGESNLIATFPADVDYFIHQNDVYNCAIVRNRENLWFLNCRNAQVKKIDLQFPEMRRFHLSHFRHQHPMVIAANERKFYDNKHYYLFDPDGNFKKIDFERRTMLCSHKSGMTLFYQRTFADEHLHHNVLLAADGSRKEMVAENYRITGGCFSNSGRYLALRCRKNNPAEYFVKIIDLAGPDQTEFIYNGYVSNLYAYQQDSFMFSSGSDFYRFTDAEFKQVQKLFDAGKVLGRSKKDAEY